MDISTNGCLCVRLSISIQLPIAHLPNKHTFWHNFFFFFFFCFVHCLPGFKDEMKCAYIFFCFQLVHHTMIISDFDNAEIKRQAAKIFATLSAHRDLHPHFIPHQVIVRIKACDALGLRWWRVKRDFKGFPFSLKA
jgi:hypothetical protein